MVLHLKGKGCLLDKFSVFSSAFRADMPRPSDEIMAEILELETELVGGIRDMKDSEISYVGYIPNDWEITRNKNVFWCYKKLVGKNSATTQLLSLTTKGIRLKDSDNAEGKLPESFDTYQCVKADDIVMCLFDLDMSAVFSGMSSYEGMISPAYKVLTCKGNIVPKFADYWFQYIFEGRKFSQYAKNIRYSLNYEDFSTLPIVFPPKEQQKHIADYLDDKCTKIDVFIEKQQAIIEKLKEYKLSIITETVTKGLNPNVQMKDSGIEWIGRIPKSWQLSHIGNLAEIGSGGTPDRNKLEYWEDGTIPWMASGEINYEYVYDTYEKITEAGLENSNAKILPVNTVMLGLIGQGKTKGMTAILKIECTCNQNLAYLKANPRFLHYQYLFYCFKAMYQYIRGLIGDSQAGIYQYFLKKQYIPLPDVKEQQIICEKLNQVNNSINRTVEKKQRIIDKLMEYKKTLIYEVVTGKIGEW